MSVRGTSRAQHRAYGLLIDSDLALWDVADGIAVTTENPEQRVEIRLLPEAPLLEGGAPINLDAASSELCWPGIALLRVTAGTLIEVVPVPEASLASVRLAVAGAGLAVLLQQRGVLVLHASSVQRRGKALCFAGPSGVGKSTIAGVLNARNQPLVSDGMTAVEFARSGELVVQAGPVGLKLWADSARALGFDEYRLGHASPRASKLVVPLQRVPMAGPTPLDHVFVVDQQGTPGVASLSPASGLVALVRNAYLHDYCDRASLVRIFQQCAQVARLVGVSALHRGTLGDLQNVCVELDEWFKSNRDG